MCLDILYLPWVNFVVQSEKNTFDCSFVGVQWLGNSAPPYRSNALTGEYTLKSLRDLFLVKFL